MKTYTVVPFDPGISERESNKKGAEAISSRLQALINAHVKQGWQYEGYESIATTVNPGCLGMLTMQGPRTVYYGVAVFYRET